MIAFRPSIRPSVCMSVCHMARRGVVVSALASINVIDTADPVNTWMGDCLLAGKPC